MKWHGFVVVACAGLMLAGCAASRARHQQERSRLAAIQAAAGKPVGAFDFMTRDLWSWEPLNEHELLVYTRPRQAWLLDVGVCPQLPYTVSIGLTSHVGQVSVMTDSVLVQGGMLPCTIERIRPVDVAKLHKEMQARKGGTMVPERAAHAHADATR
ncbi:MAG TPA: DUF6491 family protein [Rhodanobacteraceae bacterium]